MATSVQLPPEGGAETAAAAAAAVHAAVQTGQATVTVTPAPTVHRPRALPMGGTQRAVLGWLMISAPALLLTQLVALWPSVHAATTSRTPQPTTALLFGALHVKLSPDGALLVLVGLVGALASLAEVSFRFAANAGRGELSSRWTWSYALRPVQGATLATIVYFALRGGLLSVSTTAGALNPYGVAAIAGLVGLFTRQAFQKLKDVFNMLWSVDDLDSDVRPTPEPERPERRRTRRRQQVGTDGSRSQNGPDPQAQDSSAR